MQISDICAALETAMEVAKGSIGPDTKLKEHPSWDSLAVIAFISESDSKFHKVLPAKDLAEATTPAELFALFLVINTQP